MCARKYRMCARKYGPLGHQTVEIQNDGISLYEVSGLHMTSPFVYLLFVIRDMGMLHFHIYDTVYSTENQQMSEQNHNH